MLVIGFCFYYSNKGWSEGSGEDHVVAGEGLAQLGLAVGEDRLRVADDAVEAPPSIFCTERTHAYRG